jgi:hypothetical protein
MEWWNIGRLLLNKVILQILIMLSIPLLRRTIKALLHFPRPNNPLFQYSNVPIRAKPH